MGDDLQQSQSKQPNATTSPTDGSSVNPEELDQRQEAADALSQELEEAVAEVPSESVRNVPINTTKSGAVAQASPKTDNTNTSPPEVTPPNPESNNDQNSDRLSSLRAKVMVESTHRGNEEDDQLFDPLDVNTHHLARPNPSDAPVTPASKVEVEAEPTQTPPSAPVAPKPTDQPAVVTATKATVVETPASSEPELPPEKVTPEKVAEPASPTSASVVSTETENPDPPAESAAPTTGTPTDPSAPKEVAGTMPTADKPVSKPIQPEPVTPAQDFFNTVEWQARNQEVVAQLEKDRSAPVAPPVAPPTTADPAETTAPPATKSAELENQSSTTPLEQTSEQAQSKLEELLQTPEPKPATTAEEKVITEKPKIPKPEPSPEVEAPQPTPKPESTDTTEVSEKATAPAQVATPPAAAEKTTPEKEANAPPQVDPVVTTIKAEESPTNEFSKDETQGTVTGSDNAGVEFDKKTVPEKTPTPDLTVKESFDELLNPSALPKDGTKEKPARESINLIHKDPEPDPEVEAPQPTASPKEPLTTTETTDLLPPLKKEAAVEIQTNPNPTTPTEEVSASPKPQEPEPQKAEVTAPVTKPPLKPDVEARPTPPTNASLTGVTPSQPKATPSVPANVPEPQPATPDTSQPKPDTPPEAVSETKTSPPPSPVKTKEAFVSLIDHPEREFEPKASNPPENTPTAEETPVSPPVTTSAPAEKKPASIPSSLRPIRTFKDDIERTVGNRETSLVNIIASEQDKKAEEAKQAEDLKPTRPESALPRDARAYLKIALSGIFLGIGVTALVFLYFTFRPGPTVIPLGTLPEYIITEEQVNVSVTEMSRRDLMNALLAKKETLNLDLGAISFVYLTETEDLPDGGTKTTLVSSADFLERIESRAPAPLVRTLNDYMMFGIHMFDGNQPFIIFKTSFFENAFAGMLAWESDLNADLAPLFGPVLIGGNRGTSTATTTTADLLDQRFEDDIYRNKEVRALRDANGEDAVVYGFVDSDTLVITTNEQTFNEIVTRMTTIRY